MDLGKPLTNGRCVPQTRSLKSSNNFSGNNSFHQKKITYNLKLIFWEKICSFPS